MELTVEQRVEHALAHRDVDGLREMLLDYMIGVADEENARRSAAAGKVRTLLCGGCADWRQVFFHPDGSVDWHAVSEFNKQYPLFPS